MDQIKIEILCDSCVHNKLCRYSEEIIQDIEIFESKTNDYNLKISRRNPCYISEVKYNCDHYLKGENDK